MPLTQPELEQLIGRDGPEKAVALVCERSLREFVEDAWPYAVPSAKFEGNWHIDAICEHLEALWRLDIKNLLINIPPRFGKSNLSCVLFPAWVWLQDPHVRMLFSSYSQTLSTRDSLATRQLIESSWYQRNWGDRFTIARDQNEKTRFENTVKGYRLATSVGGANTGEGGDIIVCDDPHNVQEVESDIERQKAVRWWNEVMSTRGNDPRTARRLVIAQRAHFADLSGDIIEKGNYVHLNLPMEYEKGAVTISMPTTVTWDPVILDPRAVDGQPLWEGRYGEDWIAQQKIYMGPYAYAAQMQQRPTPREGGMFKRDKIQFFKPDPMLMYESGFDDSCWSWDCAFKETESSSYVVGSCWIRKGGNFYCLHLVRERMAFGATKKAIRMCASKFPKITRILVEDKANGSAVIDDMKSTIPGLYPVEPEGGKEARAAVAEPIWDAGNIFIPEGAPWAADFVQECTEFNKGVNDDQVDSMSQAINYLLKRFHTPSGVEVSAVNKSWLSWHNPRPYRDPRGE